MVMRMAVTMHTVTRTTSSFSLLALPRFET
jgi:hypothetical protein